MALDKLKKALGISLAVIAVAGVSVGITFALLTSKTEKLTNTFTMTPDIKLKLEEPKWELEGKKLAQNFAPGDKIPKDPTVSIPSEENNQTDDEYVAAIAKYYIDRNADEKFTDDEEVTYEELSKCCASITDFKTNDWNITPDKRVFYYSTKKTDGTYDFNKMKKGQAVPLFTEVEVSKNGIRYTADDVAKYGISSSSVGKLKMFKIDVVAYGVQTSNISDPKAELEKLIGDNLKGLIST